MSNKRRKPSMPPAYAPLLRRWRELEQAGRLGLTAAELGEMASIAAQMEAMELAHEMA